MTRLDNSNTNYGQKKGRESNWQFDSLISLRVGGVRYIVGKFLTRATTLLETPSQSQIYKQSYGPP
jgi:hypothetical protein